MRYNGKSFFQAAMIEKMLSEGKQVMLMLPDRVEFRRRFKHLTLIITKQHRTIGTKMEYTIHDF